MPNVGALSFRFYVFALVCLFVRLFVCLVGCFPVVVGVERECEGGGGGVA